MLYLAGRASSVHGETTVKFLFSQLTYLLGDQQSRRNLAGLGKYVLFLSSVILAFTVIFHIVMQYEGREYSWITGFYWTLTVMSTLGFGDITFASDLGRFFSVVVLLAGILLLLIVLPFAFIRFFYAPWLEAQLRAKAPRKVPAEVSGHVILCKDDPITRRLGERLELLDVPYYLIESDYARAAHWHGEGIPVIAGEVDSANTYIAARVGQARAVFANLDDAANTNITLTVREKSPAVEVIATVENMESLDVLELAGANHVLPLKQRLGEHLANRVNARHCEVHVIGKFQSLLIAEFAVHRTPLVGCSIRDSELRQTYGVNVVGVWERGHLQPARPNMEFSNSSVPVVVGTQEQIDGLNRAFSVYDVNNNPVLVIGGGKVGRAAAASLKRRGVRVHLVEHDPAVAAQVQDLADRVFVGEAAEREVLESAGILSVPSVVLTTNDDATNIYLCIYCRRLNPELRIVSRITHERNFEAMQRAGADFVVSYASIGQEAVLSILQGRELMFVGENVRFFTVKVPRALNGTSLRDSEIGARTGLNVIAILEPGGRSIPNPGPATRLTKGSELLTIGTDEARKLFNDAFG